MFMKVHLQWKSTKYLLNVSRIDIIRKVKENDHAFLYNVYIWEDVFKVGIVNKDVKDFESWNCEIDYHENVVKKQEELKK